MEREQERQGLQAVAHRTPSPRPSLCEASLTGRSPVFRSEYSAPLMKHLPLMS